VPEKNKDNQAAEVIAAPAHEFLRTEAISGRSSTRRVATIAASMLTDGWMGPPIDVVVIGTDKYIVNGHHRAHAARLTDTPVQYRIVQPTSFGYASPDEVITAHAEAGPNRIRLDRPGHR
jgi:hypothetical protein